ncbi:acetyltransferase [Gardnerella sp. DNF00257]|uniref:acyltransferase family protein n=1 Tax=Gardnerella sp. DNF00257 TaxID=2749045 RepID=UPI0003531F27|nr:acyltransferase [Gardnerella vaginalis JCP8151B]RIY21836.1 acetyltransferase [Bifidobacteriaceae bacterium VN002]
MTELNNAANAESKRNAAIDGMRAIAIIGIVAFHLRPIVFNGGFLGVTMFLVMAGYFSTVSLLKMFSEKNDKNSHLDGNQESQQKKSKLITYFKYLFKRVKRIWPSTLGIIALSAPLMWLFSPSLLTKLQSDALSGATFSSNMAYVLRKVSYFEQSGLPSPIKHLWYLGLIMQMFICWPIILCAILKIVKSKFVRMLVTATLAIVSALTSIAITILYGEGQTIARVYYSLDTRACEFLIGALLAMYCTWFSGKSAIKIISDAFRYIVGSKSEKEQIENQENDSQNGKNKGRQPILESIVGFAALAFILFCFIKQDGLKTWIVYGGYALFAIVCAILMHACMLKNNICAKILGTNILSYLGKRSFAIYLVHFPILEVLNPATRTTHITLFEQILQCVIVVAIAEVFYRIFEMPFASKYMTFSVSSVSAKSEDAKDNLKDNSKDKNKNLDLSSDTLSVKSKNIKLPFVLRKLATTVCAAACIALIAAPLNWSSIAQERSIQLRPELASQEQNNKTHSQNGKQKPESGQSSKSNNNSNNKTNTKSNNKSKQNQKRKVGGKRQNITKQTLPTKPSAHRVLNPIAEKVPANINTKPWKIDSKQDVCTADITMVGDSVTEGAKPYLIKALPNAWIDGKVSRQIFHGAEDYQKDIAEKHPGSVVIYELGTNGPPRDESVLQNMVNITGGKPVYFVTTRVPQPWQDETNAKLRAFASKRKNVGIIDWNGTSAGHSEFLTDDGIHLTPIGGPQYARMIRLAVCGG